MAVFESNYKELGFYAKDTLHTFKNGRYVTEDKEEVAVLEKLVDARRVDKPKQAEVKADAPKKAPAKKAPAKSSTK